MLSENLIFKYLLTWYDIMWAIVMKNIQLETIGFNCILTSNL